MYLPIVFFSYQMSIQQPTQNAGHCGVFFSCRRLQSLVFSLTQSHGHGYQVVIVHHRKPPFFFVHQFMRNPEMRLSSLVLTVFQKLSTTSRECRPHNTACLVWKSGLPRTYPPDAPDCRLLQRGQWLSGGYLCRILSASWKNRVYPRFTTPFDVKWVKIE